MGVPQAGMQPFPLSASNVLDPGHISMQRPIQNYVFVSTHLVYGTKPGVLCMSAVAPAFPRQPTARDTLKAFVTVECIAEPLIDGCAAVIIHRSHFAGV